MTTAAAALDTLPGTEFRLGATVREGGTNFAVASEVADGMLLCLFDKAGTETQIPMRDYDAGVWHAFVPGAGAGQAYGYRATAPYDPAGGVRCNPALRWFTPAGNEMTAADWADPNALAIPLYLDGSDDPDRAADGTPLTDDDFLVLVNAWWQPLDFVLPDTRPPAGWQVEIDTYDLASQAGLKAAGRRACDHVTVGSRSVVVLLGRRVRQPRLGDR
jgi:pullulanase/glycogen debranching enzyme